MELKYVGAMPQVSSKGVGFDQTQPDKYTFLNAAVDLLEALSFGPTETTQHLYNTGGKEYSSKELTELLKKYCKNLDDIFASREEKANALVQNLISRVNENKIINADERRAWLNNIDMMRDYYLQYVTNDSAYQCVLDTLSQEIYDAKIQEVSFPMFRNYGLVLNDLIKVLSHRKSPIDAELSVEKKDKDFVGKLTIQHR